MMSKILIFGYGLFNFLLFNLALIYFVGFMGNFIVPKTIDSGVTIPPVQALLINLALIALFGIQHSVMARPKFKQWLLKIIPEPIERSTYVLLATLMLILLCWQWQPIPDVIIWQVENPFGYWTLWGLFGFGWLFSLFATGLIDQFDLLGLRQIYQYLGDKPYQPVPFKVVAVYQYIRHPIMLGTIIGVFATPTMTIGHLLLALGFTIYIFIGIYFEEKDMLRTHGDRYVKYQQETTMLIPKLF